MEESNVQSARRGFAAAARGDFDVIGAGERVVVAMQPPPGPDGALPRTANLTTFRDGKVVEMVHYDDANDALKAIGR